MLEKSSYSIFHLYLKYRIYKRQTEICTQNLLLVLCYKHQPQ